MKINPRNLEAKFKRWNNARFAGGNYYLAVVSGAGYAKACRRIFQRASEALEYSQKVLARWARLYDAAVVDAVSLDAK